MASGLVIGLVGGTGHLGPGLAVRWAARGYKVLIGSRKREKAERIARYVQGLLSSHGLSVEIGYGENREIIAKSDVVVLTVPYTALTGLIPLLASTIKEESIVVTPVVPFLIKNRDIRLVRVAEGSVAEMLTKHLPQARIVSALHTVPYKLLLDFPKPIEGDVLVLGDDLEAVSDVMKLIREIPNLRPIYGGGLEFSVAVESLTPILINIGRRTGKPNVSIKLTGI